MVAPFRAELGITVSNCNSPHFRLNLKLAALCDGEFQKRSRNFHGESLSVAILT